MDRSALAAFLRTRREGLRPADVALPDSPRRRVPGLRRDEVAQLTGMSTDYYARLEQGRGPQPSAQMLQALARALRLTDDARDHLHRLAGQNVPARTPLDSHVAPQLRRVLDRLDDTPALIISRLGETLAQNRLAAILLGDHVQERGMARTAVYRWFTRPGERDVYPESDHERQGLSLVAGLRMALGAAGPSSPAAELAHRLSATSDEFRALWDRHEVGTRFHDRKTLIHRELGAIDVDCQALFTEDQGQALLVLTAAPRSDAAGKLELLAVLGHHRFGEDAPVTAGA
ncbi:transcriptional regulator [Clavibacter michiganensis]|uniref:Transcriptional regulator n=1 Tax=Clavibacter michiganensis TaxID=28447 RepID=A0A2S5VT92_9MICO|nr:helix-turn-helix transcriptional regulator [Clavibacter michiganensis]PPF67387.1 transcriptional regulator [Clavibacter michiganensis]